MELLYRGSQRIHTIYLDNRVPAKFSLQKIPIRGLFSELHLYLVKIALEMTLLSKMKSRFIRIEVNTRMRLRCIFKANTVGTIPWINI